MSVKSHNLRDDLIQAGIDEINQNGIANFSFRRIAAACNVSCAAPYRHFKDKHEFIAAIIDHVNDIWAVKQDAIIAACGDTLREQIIAVCLGYIRFLMEEPSYRSVLMLKDEQFDNLYHKKRTQFGSVAQTLQHHLFEASGYPKEIWDRKLMICRSLIFGSVFLFDAGEFEYNEQNMEYIRFTLNREFDVL